MCIRDRTTTLHWPSVLLVVSAPDGTRRQRRLAELATDRGVQRLRGGEVEVLRARGMPAADNI
eukprot:9265552-Alexandrium_andersonii.AAC.1